MNKRDKIKSPGFYTPMDIAPGEYPALADKREVKELQEWIMSAEYGPQELRVKLGTLCDEAVTEYRDRISTDDRLLSAPPLLVDMPPCMGCGSTKYADWSLWPHQVYNTMCPEGVGTHCFPCFALLTEARRDELAEVKS